MHPRLAPPQTTASEAPTAPQAPDSPAPDSNPGAQLSPRQRALCRAYFTASGRTGKTATACNCSRQYVYQVRTMPAAIAYLHHMETEAVNALVQARAAQLLTPLL